VRSIRSKYYVGVLLWRLEIKRVAQIPAALDGLMQIPGAGYFSRYRSDLFRYWSGSRIKNPGFVSDINRALPGTARILTHPVWELISGPIATGNVLVKLAQMLDPGLNKYIIKYNESTQEVIFKKFSIRNFRIRGGSNFLRTIDRRGLDELAALLVLIRAQEMQENYAISQRLRKLLLDFFIEISHLDEFQAVAVRMFQQTCQVFLMISTRALGVVWDSNLCSKMA
jgi:hypothetical protein